MATIVIDQAEGAKIEHINRLIEYDTEIIIIILGYGIFIGGLGKECLVLDGFSLDRSWKVNAWECIQLLSAGPPHRVCTLREALVVEAADFANFIKGEGTGLQAAMTSSIDKAKMREHLDYSGFLNQPSFCIFSENNFKQPEQFRKSFDRVVIKPAVGTASIGVVELLEGQSIEECVALIETAVMTSSKNYIKSAKRLYIAEEFLEGSLISYDGVVSGGRLHYIGSVEFIMGPSPYFVQESSIVPARLTRLEFEKLESLTQAVVEKLNIEFGAIHSEWRMTPTGPKLIEIAVRLPAGGIIDTYRKVYGVDPLRCFSSALNGTPIPKVKFKSEPRFFHNRVCVSSARPKVVVKVEFKPELNKKLIDFSIQVKINDDVSSTPSNPTVLYQYLASFNKTIEIEHIKNEISDLISIELAYKEYC